MSTQIGNIINNLGKDHEIIITNVAGDDLLKAEVTPNSLIVSALETESGGEDCMLFMSDANGAVGRITYAIHPGNGLNTNEEHNDIIELDIDGRTIDTNTNNALQVNLGNIVDDYTIRVVNPSDGDGQCLKVATTYLDKATSTSYGVIKIDNKTLKTSKEGMVYVKTENLIYADSGRANVSSGTVGVFGIKSGIIKPSSAPNPHITIRDGILTVNTENLQTASNSRLGVVKPDNSYTFVDDGGVLTVKNFTYANTSLITTPIKTRGGKGYRKVYQYNRGIIAPDQKTTSTNNGIMSVLTSGLTKASTSEYGIVKPDGVSLIVDPVTSYLCINNFGVLDVIMKEYQTKINDLTNSVNELLERVSKLETPTIVDSILMNIDKTIGSLDEPSIGVKQMPKVICIQASIVTNCQYKAVISMDNNKAPQITLDHVEYRGKKISGNDLGTTVFESTSNAKEIVSFYFTCQNFTGTLANGDCFTYINILLSSINNANVNTKRTFTLLRYNLTSYLTDSQKMYFDYYNSEELILQSDGVKTLELYNTTGDVAEITNSILFGESYTDTTCSIKINAEEVVDETSTANIAIKKKLQIKDKNLSDLINAANTISTTEVPTSGQIGYMVYYNAASAKDNSSLANTGILPKSDLQNIASTFTSYDEFISSPKYKDYILKASPNVNLASNRIINSNILDIQPAYITKIKAKEYYPDLVLVSDFDDDYMTKVKANSSYAGHLKLEITYTYTYITYTESTSNPNNYIKNYVECECDPFISVQTLSKNIKGFNNLAITDIETMPNNIAYRDAMIYLSSYGDTTEGGKTVQQKRIKYREILDQAQCYFQFRTSVFNTVSSLGTYASLSITKTQDILSYFTQGTNNSNICYIGFTYYYADSKGNKAGTAEYTGSTTLTDKENHKIIPLGITRKPTNTEYKSLKLKNITMTPFLETPSIENYSDGTWGTTTHKVASKFADAHTNRVTVKSQNSEVVMTVQIIPGINTKLSSDSLIVTNYKYTTPKLILYTSGGYQYDCDELFDDKTVSFSNSGKWDPISGITATVTFSNLKINQTIPSYVTYIAFNLELLESTGNTIFVIKKDGYSDKIGSSTETLLATGIAENVNITNALYIAGSGSLGVTSNIRDTQDVIVDNIIDLTNAKVVIANETIQLKEDIKALQDTIISLQTQVNIATSASCGSIGLDTISKFGATKYDKLCLN